VAFFHGGDIIEEKDASAPQSSDAGSKSFKVPATSWMVHEITTGFNPVIGDAEGRYDEIPSELRLTTEELERIQAALWALYYIAFDPFVPEEELIGAGDAENNPTFSVTYKVTGQSGATLTLYGENPKFISRTIQQINPEWIPGGEEPRRITGARVFALPIGSQVKFLSPSVLAEKQAPMVLAIDYPASDAAQVEFDITVSSEQLANAMVSEDEDIEPDAFFCKILFELVTESAWGNFQGFPEATWSRRTMTFSTGTIAEVKTLKGFTSNDVAVLPHDLLTNAIIVQVKRTSGVDVLTNVPVTVTKTGASTYESTIDLTGFAAGDLEEISVTYWCRDTDAGAPIKTRCPKTCANDQADPATGGRRCMAPNCSGFDDYEVGDCFQPSADGFALGHLMGEMYQQENLGLAITDPRGTWLSDLWVRTNYFLEQIFALANPRAFRYKKNSSIHGPSVQSLVGSYTTLVPIVASTYQFEHQFGAFGKRVTDSELGHLLVTGGFWRGPYELDGPVLEWYDEADVAGSLEAGCLADEVGLTDFGSSVDAYGATQADRLRMMPGRNNGGYSVADGSRSASDLHRALVRLTSADATVAAVNMNSEVEP
jgi:hypothetical protein